jgi:chlorophyll synthase
MPGAWIFAFALLYSIGAHGIMTLNDFKSVRGDQQMGVASLPVQLGVHRAARVACAFMSVPQVAVVGSLLWIVRPIHAAAVGVLLLGQFALMRYFIASPVARATRFSAFGVLLYVVGMLISAFALRMHLGSPG